MVHVCVCLRVRFLLVRSFECARARVCVRVCVRACVLVCVRACMRVYVRACVQVQEFS